MNNISELQTGLKTTFAVGLDLLFAGRSSLVDAYFVGGTIEDLDVYDRAIIQIRDMELHKRNSQYFSIGDEK